MPKWEPKEKDGKMLELIISMCINCICKDGVDNKETFISNMKLMIEKMEKED